MAPAVENSSGSVLHRKVECGGGGCQGEPCGGEHTAWGDAAAFTALHRIEPMAPPRSCTRRDVDASLARLVVSVCVDDRSLPTHIIPTPLSSLDHSLSPHGTQTRLAKLQPGCTGKTPYPPHAPLRRCRDAPPVETPSAPAECGCATNEYFVLITWTHITHDKQAARTKKRSVAAWAGWGNPRTSPASKHPPSLSKHASRRGLSRRQKSVVANTPRATCLMSPHRLSVSVARNGRVRSASAENRASAQRAHQRGVAARPESVPRPCGSALPVP